MYTINKDGSITVPQWDETGLVEDETKRLIEKGDWDYMSLDFLRNRMEGGADFAIWESDTEIYEPDEFCEPLMVDGLTAQAMLNVYDNVNEKNQATFAERIEQDRLWFGKLIEFAWKCNRIGSA